MEVGRYREWAKNNETFSIITKQPTFKESALPLSDLSGATCQTLIATGHDSDSDGPRNEPSCGPALSARLAHGVATRRPGEQLALGFVRPHFFVRNYIRRQELAKGIGRS
jgi:hypothetical protein